MTTPSISLDSETTAGSWPISISNEVRAENEGHLIQECTHFAPRVLEDEMLTTLEIVGVFRVEPSESPLKGAE